MKKLLIAILCVTTLVFLLPTKPDKVSNAPVAHAEAPQTIKEPEVVSEPTPEPTPVVEVVETPQPVYAPVSEDEAKNFIYQHESSGRLDAMNSRGCIGLGQDCNGALVNDCPNWRTDFACQDAFWERYMSARYGSWEKARQFWLSRVPIDGQDVGNWW